MSKVVSMLSHKSGKARCLQCGAEWVAVAPVGTQWLECPRCKTERGCFVHPCVRDGEEHWTCSCGNDMFHVTQDGVYCPNCGDWQNGF